MTLLNTIQSISGINHYQAEGLTDHNLGHRPKIRAIIPIYEPSSPAKRGLVPDYPRQTA